jgi:hypothetical protein
MAGWWDAFGEDDAWSSDWWTRERSFGLGDQQAEKVNEAAQFGVDAADAGIGKVRAVAAQDAKRNTLTQRTGEDARRQQRALAGLDGPEAQAAALAQIEGSPQFGEMVRQSEQAIMANASATGGLRGGNVQQSLAQNRPAILSQLIDQQYNRFGGLAAAGQQSSQFQSGLGLQAAGMQADLYTQRGQARAGGVLAEEAARLNARSQAAGALTQAGGVFSSLGARPGGIAGASSSLQQQQQYGGPNSPQGYY